MSGPKPGSNIAWGGHLTVRDYRVLTVFFGFKDWQECRAFVEEQQRKATHKALAGR